MTCPARFPWRLLIVVDTSCSCERAVFLDRSLKIASCLSNPCQSAAYMALICLALDKSFQEHHNTSIWSGHLYSPWVEWRVTRVEISNFCRTHVEAIFAAHFWPVVFLPNLRKSKGWCESWVLRKCLARGDQICVLFLVTLATIEGEVRQAVQSWHFQKFLTQISFLSPFLSISFGFSLCLSSVQAFYFQIHEWIQCQMHWLIFPVRWDRCCGSSCPARAAPLLRLQEPCDRIFWCHYLQVRLRMENENIGSCLFFVPHICMQLVDALGGRLK